MSTILSIAQMTEAEYEFAMRNDRSIVYDAIAAYNAMIADARMTAMGFFVQGDTTQGRLKYQLPIAGRDNPVRSDAQPNTLRRFGSWDVGFPIYTYKPQLTTTPVSRAYLTAAELQAHVDGINNRVDDTKRFEILYRLFNNTQLTFNDPEETLTDETIEPLANGDSVVYPPVLGSNSEATEDHYYGLNYTAISDANNPFETMGDDLIHHFGRMTGGSRIAVLINPAQRDETEALTGFVAVEDNYLTLGDDTSTADVNIGIPGEIIGRVSGCTVSVWDWIPAGYLVARHMDAPAPLLQRVDAVAGLGGGNLVNEGMLDNNAFQIDRWMYRFGIGTANRLNGVVTQLVASTTYTIPSAYA